MHFCLEVLPILPFIMMSVNSLGYGSALQMCQMKLFFLGRNHFQRLISVVKFMILQFGSYKGCSRNQSTKLQYHFGLARQNSLH